MSQVPLPTTLVRGSSTASGLPQSLAGLPVTNPNGLRRWRQALADALNAEAPIICIGDSHTFGQNADGNNASPNTSSAADAVLGYVGQLRSLFSVLYGQPGEGLYLPSNTIDSRVVAGGGAVSFDSPGQAPAMMRANVRLTAATQTLALTVPGVGVGYTVTRMMTVRANQAGNQSSTWTLAGAAQGALAALTNTGVPQLDYVNVTAGQGVVISGPAAGNDTFIGVGFRTAQHAGVPVHRVGVAGQTQWIAQGGVFNGVTGTADGATFFTNAQQLANIQACYKWAGARGLVVMYFGTNEQSLQLGTAGLNNGVTPAIFAAGVQMAVNQIVADGWCVLLVGAPPSASENLAAGAVPLTGYTAMLQAIAATTDHCAMMDMGDLWGGDTSAAKLATSNAGMRNAGDSHPTRAGYGDIARAIYGVLTDVDPIGN